ncbi:diguanylate cyclase domain-containing protein [Saccharospirillum alexandrii]|uniref:diguanylate cyclase domain-containing protein n=1 Tax=Saccharospirillum alexandrii TaxID=2448477 RepID=UPI0037366646
MARNTTISIKVPTDMHYRRFLALIVAPILMSLLFSMGASAEQSIEIEAEFLLDREGALTFEQLRRVPDSDWNEMRQARVGEPFWKSDYWIGLQGGVIWLRLEVPRTSPFDRLWVELLPNTGLNGEAFQFKQNQWQQVEAVGGPQSEGFQQPARFLTFLLDTAVEERTAYLRLTTDQVFQFSIKATPLEGLLWKSVKTLFYFGTVIGMFILAFCYNLAIGVRARERIYLTYCLFVFGNLLYLLDMAGLIRLIYPAIGTGSYLANFTSTMTVIISWVFVRELLNVRTQLPRIDRVLVGLIVVFSVLLLLIPFLPNFYGYLVAISIGIFGPPLIMVVVVLSLRMGHPLARYFFVAWTFYIISAGFWGWMWLGLVQPSEWLIFFFYAGALIEVALLSMVLGLRFSSLKEQAEALGADKIRYKTLSLTDELTGVLNRRGFLKATNQIFENRPPGTLIWLGMDIDHFKRFNDSHGHVAGDALLQKFGETLNEFSRSDDVVGRLGGEEFGLLLVGCPMDKLESFTSRLLEMFAKITVVSGNGETVSTTLSIGATLVKEGDTIESVWQRADEMLYQSKHQGRNQMVFG